MTKTISTLTAAAVFAVFATAYAQNEQPAAQMPASNQEMAAPAQAPAQAPGMGEEKKADKPAKGNGAHGKGKAKGHAKKTGKKGKDKTAGNQ
jgi:hypothetical protein